MLRSLRNRLRQLWEQCDLFDATPVALERSKGTHDPVVERTLPGTTRRPHRGPLAKPPRRSKTKTVTVRTRTRPRVPRTNPDDVQFVERLTDAFHRYNAELFNGELKDVMIRVSRRMKNRLGHYMAATPSGLPAEIAISRRHIRRDTWDEVLHTLVHEMVHQWQDEKHLPIDHGTAFRRKAREVGISDRATRRIGPDVA